MNSFSVIRASGRKAALAGAFACALGCAQAAAPAGIIDDTRAQLLNDLHRSAARAFMIDSELPLDPALRTAADKIAAEHVARIDKLLALWLDEELRLQSTAGTPSSSRVYYAVFARLLNELALWQLEPGDAQYESATLTVLQTAPAVCDVTGDLRFADFAGRVLRIQAMPVAQRGTMLETERRLLTHWGQPRAGLAPWPDPLPQHAAFDVMKAGPVDADHPRLAMPPRLASAVLGLGRDYKGMDPVEKCVVQQWWLQESLRRGVAPATALNAFRYGTMMTAVDRFGTAFDKTGGTADVGAKGLPPYPGVAKNFGATGVTRVSARVDAGGKPLQARVTGRRIDVPGIRGVRPVAFENAFDGAVATYAMRQERIDGKPAGDGIRLFDMVWSLDDDSQPGKEKGKGARP